ncbi:hypothetical protein H351_15540 [Rhodococcus erythropolis R138]|uniref:hypothetical protein n=1 Tax=Rhodococcus erythropolis TaxID=1833 RepID=UPI00049249C6|nr:hypothetical protein [Rhodococcus erythropolis]ALU73229.1 hypothetical protein H351_15540 [Rhodococcus erythropolis R138]
MTKRQIVNVKQESALDRVLARHEESRDFDIPIDEGKDPRFPDEREPWADPDRDFVTIKAKDCMVMSVPLYTTLGRHNGIQFTGTDDRIRPAFVSVDLRRRLSEAEPHIAFEKYAKVGDGQIMERIKGSQVELEVSEAVRLAHDLLLLVDLALGTSDNVNEAA